MTNASLEIKNDLSEVWC